MPEVELAQDFQLDLISQDMTLFVLGWQVVMELFKVAPLR